MIDTKQYTIDLHTHSIMSYDGGINAKQYEDILHKKILDAVAITDHNQTQFAVEMNKLFGNKIIVGEEITTTEGEIIGLFLKETIPPNLSVKKTVQMIHQQEGLVYIPHPFETIRKGLQEETLRDSIGEVDIMEVFNARAFFQKKSKQAYAFASSYRLSTAASSDAHGYGGIGSTYTVIRDTPTAKTLTALLRDGKKITKNPPLYTLLYPTINKLKHKLSHQS